MQPQDEERTRSTHLGVNRRKLFPNKRSSPLGGKRRREGSLPRLAGSQLRLDRKSMHLPRAPVVAPISPRQTPRGRAGCTQGSGLRFFTAPANLSRCLTVRDQTTRWTRRMLGKRTAWSAPGPGGAPPAATGSQLPAMANASSRQAPTNRYGPLERPRCGEDRERSSRVLPAPWPPRAHVRNDPPADLILCSISSSLV
jgi:hypothetical protein